MNNKAHLRPKDFDSNGDIIPMACKEEKGDLISRSALKGVIETYRPIKCFTDKDIGKNRMVDFCLAEIDNAPTRHGIVAFVERPKGEWIVLVDADNIQTCKCSICGRIADIANREFDKFPYCHCGAKMKGGVE